MLPRELEEAPCVYISASDWELDVVPNASISTGNLDPLHARVALVQVFQALLDLLHGVVQEFVSELRLWLALRSIIIQQESRELGGPVHFHVVR